MSTQNMLTNFFTLRALSRELENQFRGQQINEIFSQSRNELVIAFDGGSEWAIVVSIDPGMNHACRREHFTRARKNTVDLFPSITGERIRTINVILYERIICISLSNSTDLLLQLYNTAASNIFLINSERQVIESFKRNDQLRNTNLPASPQRFDGRILHDEVLFETSLGEQAELSTLSRLREMVPILGSLYAQEICSRASIDPLTPTGKLPFSSRQKLWAEFSDFLQSLDHPQPIIYDTPGGLLLSCLPLHHLEKMPAQEFPLILDAVATLITSTRRKKDYLGVRENLQTGLTKILNQTKRGLAFAKAETSPHDRADDYERRGKLVLANIHLLRKGLKEAVLPDMYGNGDSIRIKLNPKLSLPQNAEHYFRLAKETRQESAEREKRSKLLESKSASLIVMLERVEEIDSPEKLKEFLHTYRKELKAMNILSKKEQESLPPFRLFKVTGDYEVWVGKSSANNDLLTMKYAKPGDYWFHARGASGSHTVLKVKADKIVPKEAIRQAAAIAAYYSKMRKASSVPVAYCERKYVRKPRGSAQGSVILEREEIIFVQPNLP